MNKKIALIVSAAMLSCSMNVKACMKEGVPEEHINESLVSGDFYQPHLSDKEEYKGVQGRTERILLEDEINRGSISENSISDNREKYEEIEPDDRETLDKEATDAPVNEPITQPQENLGFTENGESLSGNTSQFEDEENVISGNSVSGGEIGQTQSGNELSEDVISENSVSEGETGQTQNSDEQPDEEFVAKVSIPTDVKIHFDPQNLSGKGQIFSERYQFINYGRENIAVKIKGIDVSYREHKNSYEFSDKTVENNDSETKEMNIQMVWGNENEGLESILNVKPGKTDEYVVYLKGSKYNEKNEFIELNKGSKGFFYFTGTLNSNPDLQWDNGEVLINYKYEIINGEEAREDIDEFIEKSRNATVDLP